MQENNKLLLMVDLVKIINYWVSHWPATENGERGASVKCMVWQGDSRFTLYLIREWVFFKENL